MPEAAGRLRVLERVPVPVFSTGGGVQLGTVGAAGFRRRQLGGPQNARAARAAGVAARRAAAEKAERAKRLEHSP